MGKEANLPVPVGDPPTGTESGKLMVKLAAIVERRTVKRRECPHCWPAFDPFPTRF